MKFCKLLSLIGELYKEYMLRGQEASLRIRQAKILRSQYYTLTFPHDHSRSGVDGDTREGKGCKSTNLHPLQSQR